MYLQLPFLNLFLNYIVITNEILHLALPNGVHISTTCRITTRRQTGWASVHVMPLSGRV